MIGKILKNKKGFGLLEIAVSISLVTISIIPLVNLLGSSFREERNIEEKLTAVYLAQEGAEIIRKIRDDDDTNWPPAAMSIAGDYSIVVPNTNTNSLCKNINMTGNAVLEAKNTNNAQVLTKSNNGYLQCQYGEVTSGGNHWKKSGFQRYISIDYPAVGEMRAVVKVEKNGQLLYSLTSFLNDLR